MNQVNFHSISFPSEWGPIARIRSQSITPYFHSISFPSEWGPISVYTISFFLLTGISIQLVSPASGDEDEVYYSAPLSSEDFHSISFPSEWGLTKNGPRKGQRSEVISIQLVSPASGDVNDLRLQAREVYHFHSISFPSEWGLDSIIRKAHQQIDFHSISFPSEWGHESSWYRGYPSGISIQLVSPASGDDVGFIFPLTNHSDFHSISFPSEWGPGMLLSPYTVTRSFPFN